MFEAPKQYTLKKTTEEKLFLRNISALERSFAEETDPVLHEAFGQQLAELRGMLSNISAPEQNMQAKAQFMKGQFFSAKASAFSGFPGNAASQQQHCDEGELLLKYYRLILARHSESINEKERKTVGEIKALVAKEDLTVQSLAQGFMSKATIALGMAAGKAEGKGAGEGESEVEKPYSFSENYLAACEAAYNYLRVEIRTINDVDIGISFWLTPKEIVSEKIADDEDKAILLCSVLYALGDGEAEAVIAELENGTPHAFVITEFNGKFMLLDPSQQKEFLLCCGEKQEILKKYSFEGIAIKRFLYKFNNSKYEQF